MQRINPLSDGGYADRRDCALYGPRSLCRQRKEMRDRGTFERPVQRQQTDTEVQRGDD